MVYTAKLLLARGVSPAHVAIVTADYHMERSRLLFERIFGRLFPACTLSCHPDAADISADQLAEELRIEAKMIAKLDAGVAKYCARHDLTLPLK